MKKATVKSRLMIRCKNEDFYYLFELFIKHLLNISYSTVLG